MILVLRMHTPGSARSRHLLSAPGPEPRHLCVPLCSLIQPGCAVSLDIGFIVQEVSKLFWAVQAAITFFL